MTTTAPTTPILRMCQGMSGIQTQSETFPGDQDLVTSTALVASTLLDISLVTVCHNNGDDVELCDGYGEGIMSSRLLSLFQLKSEY